MEIIDRAAALDRVGGRESLTKLADLFLAECEELMPEIHDHPAGQPGAADRKVQAYNFRMCFSDDPSNQVRFPQPAGYTAQRYHLLARLLKARTDAEGAPPKLATLLKIDRIANHKADVNNNGAFSTDYLGGSWEFPNATYRKREEIWQAHLR